MFEADDPLRVLERPRDANQPTVLEGRSRVKLNVALAASLRIPSSLSVQTEVKMRMRRRMARL